MASSDVDWPSHLMALPSGVVPPYLVQLPISMALDTIMVELQRCVKNSMGSEKWMKEWRQVERHLQAMESERGDRIS